MEFRKYIGHEIGMKMCMMGPKGVGKTSILTSIFSGTQSDLIKTNLSIRAQGTTLTEIEEKEYLFEKIFAAADSALFLQKLFCRINLKKKKKSCRAKFSLGVDLRHLAQSFKKA